MLFSLNNDKEEYIICVITVLERRKGMGTFLKYILYILLIIVLYAVVKGFYDGKINRSTTISGVVEQVDQETRNIANETMDEIKKVSK